MSFITCRFCNTSNTKLTSTINDEIVKNFLNFIPILQISSNSELTTKLCQLCIGKTKIAHDFIVKIQQVQVQLNKLSKSPRRKITETVTQENVLAKVQKVGSISVRKVSAINEVIQPVEDSISDVDDMFEVVEDDDDNDEDFNANEEYLESDNDDDSDDNDFEVPQKKKVRKSDGEKKEKCSNKEIIISAPINYTCARCKNSFPDFEVLTAHMKAKNCIIEIFKCEFENCGKEFTEKKKYHSHTATHRQREKLMCEECGKEYNHQFDLDTHMESVHRRVIRSDCIYRCSHCPDAFNSHIDLLEHVKEHQREKKEAPRLCEVRSKLIYLS
jgi:hypothetical protein